MFLFFYFQRKYTHKPFESKRFLSFFNMINAAGYEDYSNPTFLSYVRITLEYKSSDTQMLWRPLPNVTHTSDLVHI